MLHAYIDKGGLDIFTSASIQLEHSKNKAIIDVVAKMQLKI